MKKSELRDKIKSLVQQVYKTKSVDLDNGEEITLDAAKFFMLIYTERSWIAQVEGKKYYLLNLSEEEMAAESISRLLAYGVPAPAEGEAPAEETAEAPAEETPPAEEETTTA